MFGINELMFKKMLGIELSEEEKFRIIHSKKIDIKVVEYLITKLEGLYIDVLGNVSGTLFELMALGKLEGWCWQTTESVIVFLNDDDYIERGDLYFDKHCTNYYHSWICFKFNDIEYVLDPCFNFICKKELYYQLFEVKVKGHVTAESVKIALIKQVTTPKVEQNDEAHRAFTRFMKEILGDKYDEYYENKKDEVIVHDIEDPNAPLYRNGAGYKVNIEDNKIKKLSVHYYHTDG